MPNPLASTVSTFGTPVDFFLIFSHRLGFTHLGCHQHPGFHAAILFLSIRVIGFRRFLSIGIPVLLLLLLGVVKLCTTPLNHCSQGENLSLLRRGIIPQFSPFIFTSLALNCSIKEEMLGLADPKAAR